MLALELRPYQQWHIYSTTWSNHAPISADVEPVSSQSQKKKFNVSGWDAHTHTRHLLYLLIVGSLITRCLVITRVHHWWLDLYFVRKIKDKKKEEPHSPSPPVFSLCTILHDDEAEEEKKKTGLLHLSFSIWIETYFLFLFPWKHQQYKKHGYLLWQCHVSLIKKKVENQDFSVSIALHNKSMAMKTNVLHNNI